MKNPNFFIIGAPKCATTSMAVWLSEHSQIFMSAIKEPHFFSTDVNVIRAANTLEEYLLLFHNAEEQHIAVGEASVTYLVSEVAVKNILEFNPYAKFIVMLRNPIDMAVSFHAELFCFNAKDVPYDFEESWKKANEITELKHDNRNPCPSNSIYFQYQKVCKVGEQVQRLLQIVDACSVLFIMMEDIKSNPLKEYLRVLKFLDVDYDGRTNFSVYNSAKEPKYKRIRRILLSLFNLKRQLGINRELGIKKIMPKILSDTVPNKKKLLQPEFKQQLILFFKEDVNLLATLIERDLSDWLQK